jgi:hypothetical protein
MGLRYTIDASTRSVEIYLVLEDEDTDVPIRVQRQHAESAARMAQQAIRDVLSVPGTKFNRSAPDEPPRLQTSRGRDTLETRPTDTGFIVSFREIPASVYMSHFQLTDREFILRALEGVSQQIEDELSRGLS